MFYDVSILTLMIIGVIGIIMYSYKMSRSRVYPVGIVHKSAVARPDETIGVTSDEFILGDKLEILRTWDPTSRDIENVWRLYEHDVMRRRASRYREISAYGNPAVAASSPWKTGEWRWCCPICGHVQPPEKDLRCARCAYTPKPAAAKETGNPPEHRVEAKRSPVHAQVAQHDRTLQDFEERIRKLEKLSVVQRIGEIPGKEVGPSDWTN